MSIAMCQRKCQVHPLLLILVDKSGQKSKRMKHSEPAVHIFLNTLAESQFIDNRQGKGPQTRTQNGS